MGRWICLSVCRAGLGDLGEVQRGVKERDRDAGREGISAPVRECLLLLLADR